MATKNVSDIELALAAVIRAEMGKRRLSANKFASSLGMSQPALSAKLRGETKFGVQDLAAAAEVFGMELSAIIVAAERQLKSDPEAIFGLAAETKNEDNALRQERDQELP